jgi:threonine dehydrogenase-like Zn-dependent dehydrogenase
VNTQDDDYLQQIEAIAEGPVDGLLEATGDAALAEDLLNALQPDGFAMAYGVPPTGTEYHPRWQSCEVEEHLSFPWWWTCCTVAGFNRSGLPLTCGNSTK